MGMGYNINTFTPYIPQPIGFGGLYPYASITSAKTETEAEKKERLKKEQAQKASEEFMKKLELIQKQAELAPKLEAQIKEFEAGKKDLDETINRAKTGKESEDGTVQSKETWSEYKKLPLWKKGLRAVGAMVLDAPIKLAEGFVGYEKDEATGESKWNWKKGLFNGVIAVGCGILCACTAPISLPLIGATTVGIAASGTLIATGAACGIIGTAKGIHKVSKAIKEENPEELDNAFQDIGTGLTIGIASAIGARSLGASLESSAAASGASNAVRNSGNSFFKGVEYLTKEEYSKGSNAVTSFMKDATVNAFRKLAQSGREGRASYEANGLFKSWGSNIVDAIPKLGKTKFTEAQNKTTQSITGRLKEITAELKQQGLTADAKALLQQEQSMLNAQLNQLNSTTAKSAWAGLKTNSKAHNEVQSLKNAITELESNGTVRIGQNNYAMSEANMNALKATLNRAQKLSKEIEKLSKVRSATIKKMAFLKKYASEVEGYTGKTRTSRLGRIYDAAKITKSDITWKKALLSPFKVLWEVTMIPFKPWNYVQKSPSSTAYKLKETFVPTYEAGFLTTGFMAETLNMGERTLKAKIITQDEKGEAVEQEVAITKEVLAQLEEQKQQLDKAIADAQGELSKLYIA